VHKTDVSECMKYLKRKARLAFLYKALESVVDAANDGGLRLEIKDKASRATRIVVPFIMMLSLDNEGAYSTLGLHFRGRNMTCRLCT
jgi:hypothetical protein